MSRNALRFVLLAALAAACRQPPQQGEGQPCDPGDHCRAFLACIEGVCRAIEDAAMTSDPPDAGLDAASERPAGDLPDTRPSDLPPVEAPDAPPDLADGPPEDVAPDGPGDDAFDAAADAPDAAPDVTPDDAVDVAPDVTPDDAADVAPDTADATDVPPEAPGAPGDDARPEGPPPPDGSTWTPAARDGLVLWLDAGKGIELDPSNHVSQWFDLSDNHHNAGQANPARRPVFSLAGAHGHSLVAFGAPEAPLSYLLVSDAQDLQPGTGDFAVWVVGSTFNTASADFLHKRQAVAPFAGWQLGVTDQAPDDNRGHFSFQLALSDPPLFSDRAGYNDGKLILVGARRFDQTKVEVRVNGQTSTFGSVGAPNVDAPGEPLVIGSGSPGDLALQLVGGIAEIVVVRGPLTTPQIAELEEHLKAKYSIP